MQPDLVENMYFLFFIYYLELSFKNHLQLITEECYTVNTVQQPPIEIQVQPETICICCPCRVTCFNNQCQAVGGSSFAVCRFPQASAQRLRLSERSTNSTAEAKGDKSTKMCSSDWGKLERASRHWEGKAVQKWDGSKHRNMEKQVNSETGKTLPNSIISSAFILWLHLELKFVLQIGKKKSQEISTNKPFNLLCYFNVKQIN